MQQWCGNCGKQVQLENTEGKICCSACGKVIDEDNFSNEPTFFKNASGQSQFSGNFVKTVQNDYSASRERILNNACDGITGMAINLGISGGDSITRPALAFYRIAIERNFTRGRRKELVEAACLYISCRENKSPFLLIDFSELLRTNVYVLGAVFLQLCKLLSLEEHPIVQKPIDPTLFIDRFTDRLLGKRNLKVSRTALRIIASMKRDWMQTGRKPSGLCGAALYISALSHGLKYSKSDVVKVVHICEATLTKRLIEFENTESGGLTIEEFNSKAEELEKEDQSVKQRNIILDASGKSELLCEHKGSGIPSFAHGLCRSCYDDFMKLSGGLEGGSEPPAFQRSERERAMTKESADTNLEEELEVDTSNVSRNGNLPLKEPEVLGVPTTNTTLHDSGYNEPRGADGASPKAYDESGNFSDIDDIEVDGYLHNEEEKHYKKIIWEEMNREYLEEQAAKEAAAAAAKKAYESSFSNCPEDMQAAQELAAAAAAAVAKSRKERQQKRAADARNSLPPQTAAEATRQMLTKKRLSSKINYDVLEKLFDESAAPEIPKKSKTESDYNEDSLSHDHRRESELEDTTFEDVGVHGEAYINDYGYENVEGYDYEDDYGFEEY